MAEETIGMQDIFVWLPLFSILVSAGLLTHVCLWMKAQKLVSAKNRAKIFEYYSGCVYLFGYVWLCVSELKRARGQHEVPVRTQAGMGNRVVIHICFHKLLINFQGRDPKIH